ncbi:scopoletin glucosyltransferase [Spinacia oleracea]|uniref:Glycosyltransferase n=1 Tax=Spinacia oleracea TaxID=3562 RepID=A0A9R0JLW9_SPIOL|nr:scopoletin glucosyltransferase-like [Spinacia oleracea]
MAVEAQELHVVFFPFLSHGHMIPTLHIARLFAARDNVKATIITTPLNMATFTKPNENSTETGAPIINIQVFKFPAKEAGLPDGCENPDQLSGPGMIKNFFKATEMLNEQLEQYLEKIRPDCLVADMFYPWATKCTSKFNIPRLVFHGFSCFSLCAQEVIRLHEPYNNVSSDDELFVLPSIPHEIQLTRLQIPEALRIEEESFLKSTINRVIESEVESYGVIVNSFYELEPDYAEFFTNELGRKAWNIGPVSVTNKSPDVKAIDKHECLKWLNSKKPNSVIYICFGSTARSIDPQLHEIAMGLESSGKQFIWVVRNKSNSNEEGKNEEVWLPPGFEQRTEGKGLIIRGWAPQVSILEHEAIGAFVTHCGWNSTLEGITAGVPMVTWPMFAEQFYNEKLVTEILKIGVPVGVKKWSMMPSVEDMIKGEAVEMALREIMDGKEVEEMRNRANKLKEMAWKAVEEGGSSYSDLSALINELRNYQSDQL